MSRAELLEKELSHCMSELSFLNADTSAIQGRSRKLIISSGDISDPDGFYAIAQYAKTGADVLFVMNYPAYLKEEENSGEQETGLGFKYDADTFMTYCRNHLMDTTANDKAAEAFREYTKVMDMYMKGDVGSKMKMKDAMDAIAFTLLHVIWKEQLNADKGRLYFCKGGVNDINPFNFPILKNEVFVYASIYTDPTVQTHPTVSLGSGKAQECGVPTVCRVNTFTLLDARDAIYIDFNGSMAFLDDQWRIKLINVRKKIKGAFVLGGVMATERPQTMPASAGIVNRLSCATMNQLFSPASASAFFSLMATCDVPIFIVPNNTVGPISDSNTPDDINDFLDANEIGTATIKRVANLYYFSRYNPPPKAFDLYSALALKLFLQDPDRFPKTSQKTVHFDEKYGAAVVHDTTDWHDAVRNYKIQVMQSGNYTKKPDAFENEFRIIEKLDTRCVEVRVVSFKKNASNKLSVVDAP